MRMMARLAVIAGLMSGGALLAQPAAPQPAAPQPGPVTVIHAGRLLDQPGRPPPP